MMIEETLDVIRKLPQWLRIVGVNGVDADRIRV